MSVAAVVFDLYGTLLAIDSMRMHVAAAGVADPGAFVADWRRKQLEYAFLTSLANAYRDFDALTADALAFTCDQHEIALDPSVQRALVNAWRTLLAYGDVTLVLKALAGQNIPLAVLTNGTPSSAHAALEHAGVRALLTDVLSVDSVRAYKPDPRVYALVTARFACAPDAIVFVSSNAWDAWGAATFGFRVAWCNRAGNTAERLSPAPHTMLAGLHELPAFVAHGESGYISAHGKTTRRRGASMKDTSESIPDAGPSEEPALTQRNTATVLGEENLSADAAARGGAAPTYGPAGNTTDAEEEGADGHGI